MVVRSLKSKSLDAETLISFRFWGQRADFQSKCLHLLLGEGRLLDASELENDHNSWAFISFMIIYLDWYLLIC